jgi:hypothetical protein
MSKQDELQKQMEELKTRQAKNDCCFDKANRQHAETNLEISNSISALEAKIADEAKLKMKIGDMFLGVVTNKPILIIQTGVATRGVYEDGEEICFQDDEYAEEVLLFNSFATLKRNEAKEISK